VDVESTGSRNPLQLQPWLRRAAFEYAPLEPVVDPVAALADTAPLVFAGQAGNLAARGSKGGGPAVEGADVITSISRAARTTSTSPAFPPMGRSVRNAG
jgi:hypothetical protein